jgi:hypothetical protein
MNLDEYRKKQDELTRRFRQDAQKTFFKECQMLFTAHPKLKSFGWTQETGWNEDRDGYGFRTRATWDEGPEINGYTWRNYNERGAENDPDNLIWRSRETVRGYDRRGKEYGESNTDYDPDAIGVIRAVESFLQGYSDEWYRVAFGDESRIVVTRQGITIR